MKTPILTLAVVAMLAWTIALPRDWRYEQQFSIAEPRLVKLNLPAETLDAARAGLEDLRLYDDAGNEMPFMIERPTRTEIPPQTLELDSVPVLDQPATITDSQSSSGETRLTVNLGAANLTISDVRIETVDPLFTRTVILSSLDLEENSVREVPIGQGRIYRVAVEGQPSSMNLSVPVERQIPSRELLVLIRDENSPPLHVTAVHVERRPVYLLFMARHAGTYHLLLGNRSVGAPRYDEQRFGANFKDASVAEVQITALMDNPEYRPRDALPGRKVPPFDASAWKFRKPIRLAEGSAHRIELDLDVLSHANVGMTDLRLLQGDVQIPYVFQRTSISRELTPVVTATNDPKNPGQSRWTIKLPRAGLPLTRLVCMAKTPLFQREMWVSEQLTDDRGKPYHRILGRGSWSQAPERRTQEFALALDVEPRSDTLFVETDNGNDSPIELEKIRGTYTATRLLFKAKPDDNLFLYYGNPKGTSPRYDLSLVARDLLAAGRTDAILGAEERVQKDSSRETGARAKGGVLVWGLLALVVTVLLFLISRMLPKSTPPAGDGTRDRQ